MGRKSCFFIGHREASEEIYPALYAAVEQHIVEYGVKEFIIGHYGGFDRLAASAVKAAKHLYPDVKLILLMSKADLRKAAGRAPNTMTKLRRDEEVKLSILCRICAVLHVNFGDIIDFVPSDAEKENRDIIAEQSEA